MREYWHQFLISENVDKEMATDWAKLLKQMPRRRPQGRRKKPNWVKRGKH